MKHPRRLIATLAATALLAVAGCAGQSSGSSSDGTPVSGGTLKYGAIGDPGAGGFDPYVTGGAQNFSFIFQIYQPLLGQDAAGKPAAGLADKWEQVNPTTYKFHIRDGAKFSDGTQLTADDVTFSLLTMRDKSVDQAPHYANLKSAESLDESTVKVELKSPSALFLKTVSDPSSCFIVNKKWYESTDKEKRQTETLGTGPFSLADWKHGASLKLVANKSYWEKGKPYLAAIDFTVVPNEETRLADIKQGTFDMIWVRDSTLANDAKSAGLKVGDAAPSRTVPFYLNQTEGVLKNEKFRQAISQGLDRKQIIDLAMGGQASKTLNVPPGAGGFADVGAFPNMKHDLDGAKALLKESGVTDPSFTLTYASDAAFALDAPMVEIVKDQLKKVGITVNLKGLPFSEVLEQALSGDYKDMLLMPLSYSSVPSGYLRYMQDAPRNRLGVNKAEALKLLDAVNTAPDDAALKESLRTLETFSAEKVLSLVPYAMSVRTEIWTDKVGGYKTDRSSARVHLKDAWIDR